MTTDDHDYAARKESSCLIAGWCFVGILGIATLAYLFQFLGWVFS